MAQKYRFASKISKSGPVYHIQLPASQVEELKKLHRKQLLIEIEVLENVVELTN